MVWSVRIAEPGAPHRWGKNDSRQQEKDAGNLKPQNPADAPERAQKTTDSPSNALAGTLRGLDCGAHRIACCGRVGNPNSLYCRRLSAGSQPLAGEASGYAKPDAKSPADGLRSHPIYDGSSVLCWLAALRRRSLLGGCSLAGLAVR